VGREIWQKTEALVVAVSGDISTLEPLDLRLQAVEREHPDLKPLRPLISANEEAHRDVGDISRLVSRQACGDPRQQDVNRVRANQFGFAMPLCAATGVHSTIRIVPQQSADVALTSPVTTADTTLDTTSTTSGGSGALPLHSARVRRAIADAELFGMAVDSSIKRLAEDKNAEGPMLVAAYFISFDSVLEYWNRYAPIPASEFPHYRLWAGRTYVEQMLRQEGGTRRVVTRPYVDFGGNGVVYTECNAVHRRDSTDDARSPAIVGVVCLDYAPREEELLSVVDEISSSALAEACLVAFHSEAPASWSNRDPKLPGDEGSRRPAHESPCAITRHSEVRQWLDRHAADMAGDTKARRQIAVIDTAPKPMFLIPVGLVQSGVSGAILISIEAFGATGSRPWATLFTLIAIMVAVAAGMSGSGSSKRLADREALLGRLRSLQIAVVQTDANDYITAGNDRAEEIVGRTLPNFGLSQKPVYLWELFDENTICIEKPGAAAQRAKKGEKNPLEMFDLKDMKYIWKLRRRGETSTYYGRLLNPLHYAAMSFTDGRREELSVCTWVKVTGGPILQTSPSPSMPTRSTQERDQALATFGVLEPASDDEAKDLARFVELKRSKG
jgi:PAS domain-containing protein